MLLHTLHPLSQVSGVEFHSLQRGPAAAQLSRRSPEFEIIEHELTKADFLHTANLIEKLDLVISVDTAVAHLAGAMGKTVWLMLPYAADWRWMLDREDSPWYSTMRLFRQQRWGDWDEVVARVARNLADLAGRGSSTSNMTADPSSSA